MKSRFLCGPHRLELSRRPERAIVCWQNSTDTAQHLCDQKRYKEALPYLGSAFESAEIIMTIKAVESIEAYEAFATSAVLLAGNFARLDYTTESMNIYWMVIHRLERELTINGTNKNWVLQYLEFFYGSVQNPDFTGSTTNTFQNAIH